MAKNTMIERSKENPIELEHRTWRIGYPQFAGFFITCIEHRYAVVLLGFSGHDATFTPNFIGLWLKWLKLMHFRVYWTKK